MVLAGDSVLIVCFGEIHLYLGSVKDLRLSDVDRREILCGGRMLSSANSQEDAGYSDSEPAVIIDDMK